MLYSVTASLVSEGLSWLLIYRKADYKRKADQIQKLQEKLEKAKSTTVNVDNRQKAEKKRAADQRELQRLEQSIQQSKIFSSVFLAGVMITMYSMASSAFDGIVVAKLPFTPFGFIQGLSHRGLPSNDYTDCSMTFLYAICSFGIRPSIMRLIGNKPPKTTSLWDTAAAQSQNTKWQ